jgi:hypothetical protein
MFSIAPHFVPYALPDIDHMELYRWVNIGTTCFFVWSEYFYIMESSSSKTHFCWYANQRLIAQKESLNLEGTPQLINMDHTT